MRRGGPRNQHIKTSLKGSIYLTFGKMKKWWTGGRARDIFVNGGAREKCCLVALLCLFFAARHLPQSLAIKHES